MNEKKDNTEEKILKAAKTVFIRKGMDGARMQQIADEAGINKALLHYYFRNKQKLFEAVFSHAISQIFPNIEQLIRSEKPIEEKLSLFIGKYIDLLMENPFLPAFILKEINRDPEFLASRMRQQGIDTGEVMNLFEQEMKHNNIRRMDPRELLINIIALCVFPLAARPLLEIMLFQNDKEAYTQLLAKRKETVMDFILRAILPEDTSRKRLV